MINEVHLIVRKGDGTTYTSGIFGVSVPLQKIYLNESTGSFLGCDIYNQLVGLEVDVYGASGFLDTVTITSVDVYCTSPPFSGTLEYTSANPSAIASGTSFVFTLGNGKEFYVDLYENESISQNWSFTDLAELKATGS